jgi:16S rRNA (adenine1518-N6/adenine1519-N6)-dimethyltransferase
MGARFGQHFLANPHVAGRIAQALALKPGDAVLEIGPGKGALTRHLLAAGAHVVGVEIDEDLYKGLEGRFRGDRLTAVLGDALEVDLASLFRDAKGPVKVAGNIPYKITSPLLERLTLWREWDRAVLMVQEEVAKRITAPPGTRTYGVLSVGVGLVAETRFLFGLSKHSFRPVPQVDAAVIELIRRPQNLSEGERKKIMTVARAAFSQRRKTIANALSDGLDLPKDRAQEALKAAGIDPGARAETVDLDGYRRLSDTITNHD